MKSSRATMQDSPFLKLPSELIIEILSYLSLTDLLSVGLVNRHLHQHSLQDTLYHNFVQAHVPGNKLTKPTDSTWRDLYITHHPFWFIPQHKIWFSDQVHLGKLLIARYNQRINAIEAYALVAERKQPAFLTWDWNPEAIIHTFTPRIQLDLNHPVVRLDAAAYANATGGDGYRLQKEIPMQLYDNAPRPSAGIHSRLMLTKPWPTHITTRGTPVWPPLTLPSNVRTRNDSASHFRDLNHRPKLLSELSTKTFRTRRWIEFSSRPTGVSMRVGEDTQTWATLPEECYRPTPQKPWQGIWCGDYAGHGCEFLAILQPDDPKPLPEKALWAMRSREREDSVSSDESWNTAPTEMSAGGNHDTDMAEASDASSSEADTAALCSRSTRDEADTGSSPAADGGQIYRGRIEAIKLTGDPNVPRGEYTFIAPDIGPQGLVRVATEDMFKGARIVKSVGHIAAQGFRDDDFMVSQLILISHNRLAQYWETFGHVSFYERVDIDQHIKAT
ncbi:uncharacterized protein EI97DRAFT_55145 [Westerdykella ornata]|uniref:F-box domain-containing protein n=1 Tax=Westerdykella ornata TaxID=318751 RepID=A0A6A6JHC6_WESOR|nr:uncharacterized protein EI97DRAFT_55145 [Westerdykella ornata]KAF2275777.1 hypothetical protein EI97DRAFT_55145 [Westerdykella ornata]